MEAAGLAIAVVGLCADIRTRLESVRNASRAAQRLVVRIERAQESLSRVAAILERDASSTSGTFGPEPLRTLQDSLQRLSGTVDQLHRDLQGKRSRWLRARLPFALDANKAQTHEKALDQIVADITVFTSTANLDQVSSLARDLRNLSIAPRGRHKDGFNLKFHTANVPFIHHFEGRETFLARLATGLLPGPSRGHKKLEIISGLGGMGKTSLAVQFARLNEDKFSAIFFVDANSYESLSRSFSGLHQFLLGGDSNRQRRETAGGPGGQSLDAAMVREVLDWFCLEGNAKWLLIFDNNDRQPSDPEGVDITKFFPPCDAGSILITTRLNPLHIDGLSKAQIELRPMSQEESRRLLNRSRNMGVEPRNAHPSSETEGQQTNLIERLEGLPLALAQAGSFLRTTRMSLAEYLNLYDGSRRQLLESQRPLLPTGEGSLRGSILTTWTLSLRDLGQRASRGSKHDNALKLLRFITFFDPTDIDFTILCRGLISHHVPDWFEAVFASPLSFVTTAELLVERSLLNATSKYATYTMHRVVYDWLCAEEDNNVDEQLLNLAMTAIAVSAPGRRLKSWAWTEKRLITHAVAMSRALSRCPFTSVVSMVDLGAQPGQRFDRALRLARDPNWHKEVTQPWLPLAHIVYLLAVDGKAKMGLDIIDAALSGPLSGGGNEQQVLAAAALTIAKGQILYQQGKHAASRSCLSSADVPEKSRFLEFERQLSLANVLSEDKASAPQAVKLLKKSMAKQKRLGFAFNHPWVIETALGLVFALNKSESPDTDTVGDRLRLLEPYKEYAEQTAPHSEPSRALLSELGGTYMDLKATEKALPILHAVAAIELPTAADPSNFLYYDLFKAYLRLNDLPQALHFCQKWVEVRQVQHGTQSIYTGESLNDLCFIKIQLKDWRGAVEAGSRAAGMLGPSDEREYWSLCWRLRDAYKNLKEWEQATMWARKTAEMSAGGKGITKAEHEEDKKDLEDICQMEIDDIVRTLHP